MWIFNRIFDHSVSRRHFWRITGQPVWDLFHKLSIIWKWGSPSVPILRDVIQDGFRPAECELCLFSADSLQAVRLLDISLLCETNVSGLRLKQAIENFSRRSTSLRIFVALVRIIMLIKEYRIPLPMSVEEYRIAQLYMIQVWFFCSELCFPTVLHVRRSWIATANSRRFRILFVSVFVYVHVKVMYLEHSLSLVNKLSVTKPADGRFFFSWRYIYTLDRYCVLTVSIASVVNFLGLE